MKRKTLGKKYKEFINNDIIYKYSIEGNVLRKYYINGKITSEAYSKEAELKTARDMQYQALMLEHLIKEYKNRGSFIQMLTCLLILLPLYSEIANQQKANPIEQVSVINYALLFTGWWSTLLGEAACSDKSLLLEKIQFYINHEKDINSDFCPNQLNFDKNDRPINGYHRMTFNDVQDIKLSELRQYVNDNQQREFTLKMKQYENRAE